MGNIQAAKSYPLRLNYHEGSKTGLGAEIYGLVKDILQSCNTNVTEFCEGKGKICAGLTGVTTKYDRVIGTEEIWRAAGLSETHRITTGGIEIAFTGATRSLLGAALSCHVGSAAIARTSQTIRRVGGWGPLTGDEGSGYWIGTRALNALFRLRDERLQVKTALPHQIQEVLKTIPIWVDTLKQHSKVQHGNWVDALILLTQLTRDTKQYRYIVSDIATAVFKTLEDYPDDPIARDIVTKAAQELVEQAGTALIRAELSEEPVPLVLWGGIFRYQNSFCNLVSEMACRQLPNVRVIKPTDSGVTRPVIGALLFALSGSIFALPSPTVIQNVERSIGPFPELDNY
jgi:N-acetylglucosamine kinase-like BadF-type ATPase